MALLIEINEEHPTPKATGPLRDVDGGCRLPNAAFLICDCEDFHPTEIA